MTPLDRLLQRLRVRAALPHIPEGARLHDVGCADGHLLRAVDGRIRGGVGIDPNGTAVNWSASGPSLGAEPPAATHRIVRGAFPDDLDDAGPFDVITMLAVFEHFRDADRPRVVDACRRLLRPGGRVVMTVPAPVVDRIVDLPRALRLVHGMHVEAHHGYRPEETAAHFSGFRVVRHDRFELGLNNLYVLENRARSGGRREPVVAYLRRSPSTERKNEARIVSSPRAIAAPDTMTTRRVSAISSIGPKARACHSPTA